MASVSPYGSGPINIANSCSVDDLREIDKYLSPIFSDKCISRLSSQESREQCTEIYLIFDKDLPDDLFFKFTNLLIKLKNVQIVTIEGLSLSDTTRGKQFADAIAYKKLEQLKLTKCSLGFHPLKNILLSLQNTQSIKILSFENTPFTEELMNLLGSYLGALGSLTSLTIREAGIDAKALLPLITHLSISRSLLPIFRRLNLFSNPLDFEKIKALVDVLNNFPAFSTLEMQYNKLTEEEEKAIIHLKRNFEIGMYAPRGMDDPWEYL